MSRVAVLSKSSSVDSQIDRKLKQLGFEVFFSLEMMESLVSQSVETKLFLRLFPTIIFAETVPDMEIKQILQCRATNHNQFFRCDSEAPSEECLKEWQEIGLTNWLPIDISLSDLREKVFQPIKLVLQPNYATSQNILPFNEASVSLLESSLSSKEKILFELLKENKGTFISRDTLSKCIWKCETTNSTLSQLSQISKKLKDKMRKFGISPDLLLTNWHHGYALSEKFFQNTLETSSSTVE